MGKPFFIASLLLYTLVLAIARELHPQDSEDVVVLTDNNFDERLTPKNYEMWIVMFYSSSCTSCEDVESQWSLLATQLKGNVVIAKVDGTKNPGLVQRFRINAYPSSKLFPTGPKSDLYIENFPTFKDVTIMVSSALEKKAQYENDNGSLDFKDVLELGQYSKFPQGSSSSSSELWIVLFATGRDRHWNKLATYFKGEVNVCLAVDSSRGGRNFQRYGVNQYPTINLYGFGDVDPFAFIETYPEHTVDFRKIVPWVWEMQTKYALGPGSSDSSDVIILNDSNFDERLRLSEHIWIIHFAQSMISRRLETQLNRVATELKGQVNIGKVDLYSGDNLQLKEKFGVSTTRIFPSGTLPDFSIEGFTGYKNSSFIYSWALEMKSKYEIIKPEHDHSTNTTTAISNNNTAPESNITTSSNATSNTTLASNISDSNIINSSNTTISNTTITISNNNTAPDSNITTSSNATSNTICSISFYANNSMTTDCDNNENSCPPGYFEYPDSSCLRICSDPYYGLLRHGSAYCTGKELINNNLYSPEIAAVIGSAVIISLLIMLACMKLASMKLSNNSKDLTNSATKEGLKYVQLREYVKAETNVHMNEQQIQEEKQERSSSSSYDSLELSSPTISEPVKTNHQIVLQELRCEACERPFDLIRNFPISLRCGHKICPECKFQSHNPKGISKCPVEICDKGQFGSDVKVDSNLMKVMKASSEKNSD